MNLQEDHYTTDYDYWPGSPHLRHRHLHEDLLARSASAIEATRTDRPPRVVEVGAGDGSITERLLALGFEVTGTDMSADSVATMEKKFGLNDRFTGIHDPDGSLKSLGGDRFDAIMYSSVLHHIPDYLGHISDAVENHLDPGGSLVAIQDPLWYSRLPASTNRLTQACFLSWRLGQGELSRGLKTRARRWKSGISEEEPGDSVEYHVVREGVDEQAVASFCDSHFQSVDLYRYWSSQGVAQQRLGERLGRVNTFAVFATGLEAG